MKRTIPVPAMMEFYERAKAYATNAIEAGVLWYEFEDAIRTAVIDAALEKTKGNKKRAARLIGMGRSTLLRNL